MTREEAADILIAASPELTSKEQRSRNAKWRRDKLISGDTQMIRAMLLTAVPKGEEAADEIKQAIQVLSKEPS